MSTDIGENTFLAFVWDSLDYGEVLFFCFAFFKLSDEFDVSEVGFGDDDAAGCIFV